MPQRIVQKQRPGWVDRLGDVSRARKCDGGDSCCFELAGDQTNCLMTNRSNRDEQDRFDLVALTALYKDGSEFISDSSL